MSISTEFDCKCGKFKNWVTEGKRTKPCPECNRVYMGKYNEKKLTLEAKEGV